MVGDVQFLESRNVLQGQVGISICAVAACTGTKSGVEHVL